MRNQFNESTKEKSNNFNTYRKGTTFFKYTEKRYEVTNLSLLNDLQHLSYRWYFKSVQKCLIVFATMFRLHFVKLNSKILLHIIFL